MAVAVLTFTLVPLTLNHTSNKNNNNNKKAVKQNVIDKTAVFVVIDPRRAHSCVYTLYVYNWLAASCSCAFLCQLNKFSLSVHAAEIE